MHKIILSICVVFITQCAVAQIETDRPNFTSSTNVLPKGALQIETGFVLEKNKESVGGIRGPSTLTQRNLTVNTSLFRFGLTDKVELRLYTAVNSNQLLVESGLVIPDTTIKTSGFQTSFIGFKTNFYKSDKVSIGFLGHLYIPELASGDFANIAGQRIAPEFLIPLTYDITDRFGIAVQYGLSWDGSTPNPTTSYTLSLGYSITDKLSAYVEPYGFHNPYGETTHLVNGGFTYLINDDFQVDLTGGFGLNEAAPDNFINCGASFLLFNK
jgi:hypothetical protein